MQAPVTVLTTNAKRETGRKAQLGNIAAAKAGFGLVWGGGRGGGRGRCAGAGDRG